MPKELIPPDLPDNLGEMVKIASNEEDMKLLNRDEKKEHKVLRQILLELTSFEIRFIEQYIRTASASQAAKLAGSKAVNPEQVGYKLLQKPKIQQAIAIAMKKRIEAVGLDTIEVIQKIREVYDVAMTAGKYETAIKACELLQKEIDKAGKLSKVGEVTFNKPVHQEDGVNITSELEKVVTMISRA